MSTPVVMPPPPGQVPTGSISDGELASANNAVYKTLLAGSGRYTTAGAGATIYAAVSTAADAVMAQNASVNQLNVPWYLNIASADYAVAGLTTRLRLACVLGTATGPGTTVTPGLYPITAGATITPGTVVAGSTVAYSSPGANTFTVATSGDFALPANGLYGVGYVLGGIPAGNGVFEWKLEIRHT